MYSPVYLIDTNVFLSRDTYQNYDEPLFKVYWDNFDDLVDCGKIISTFSVYKEIEINSLKIFSWAKNHKEMFKSPPDDKFGIELNSKQENFSHSLFFQFLFINE